LTGVGPAAQQFSQTIEQEEAETTEELSLFSLLVPVEIQDWVTKWYNEYSSTGSIRIMATITDIGTLITQTSEICGGRPRIAGTGVSVRRIVTWYQLGYSPEEIEAEIPHLTLAQIHAALAYYHANREAMDREMAAEAAETERLEREFLESRKSS
jgi:uncharacterized protein (DUF433 family)